MRKILYVIILLLFSQCKELRKTNKLSELDILSDCLKKENVTKLSEGILIFKKKLRKKYQVEGRIKKSTYTKFLNDFSRMSLSRDFFSSKEAIDFIKKIKSTSIFNDLYKKYEETNYDDAKVLITKSNDEENVKEKLPDFFISNYKGEFSACLLEKTNNKGLKDYLKSIAEFQDISPTIKAGAMIEVLDKVKKDEKVAILAITFNLYYESVLMFNKF